MSASRAPSRYRIDAPPPPRPLLVWDGDCGFCRYWVSRWRGATRDRVDYATSQTVADRFPGIPHEVFARTVVLIMPDGEALTGAEAVFGALATVPTRRAPLFAYRRIPGIARLSETFYGLVAGHRSFFSRMTWLLWGKSAEAPSFTIACSLFLRLMGLAYFAAFVSLWVQIAGLVGRNGILPAAPFLSAAREQLGTSAYWVFPTVVWLAPGDGVLHALCAAGALFSLCLIFGIAPAPLLFLLWAAYLSLATVCRGFLGYQWDNLLLEAGLLAAFLSPLLGRASAAGPERARWRRRLVPRPLAEPHSRLFFWLLLWLLFRLMFSSGFVKLGSGDPHWRDLSALDYHYWTQPLPIWTSWYVDKLPSWFQGASVAMMFAIELGAPFLIFAPRRLRLVAFWALVGLQTLIAATGNYAFFNLLSLALCLLLIDDASWPSAMRVHAYAPGARAEPAAAGTLRFWFTAPIGALLLFLSVIELSGTLRIGVPWPRPVLALGTAASPFRSVNGYGLFAVMTTTRYEIIVEGSDDGRAWLPYEFKWKPGEVGRHPRLVAPHQPRLDWQMWFAALSDYRANPWFLQFLEKLLEGSPDVLGLLETNPFPDRPPRYLRARVFDYHFTDRAEGRASGAWWKREPMGLYCPIVSLRADQEDEAGGGDDGADAGR